MNRLTVEFDVVLWICGFNVLAHSFTVGFVDILMNIWWAPGVLYLGSYCASVLCQQLYDSIYMSCFRIVTSLFVSLCECKQIPTRNSLNNSVDWCVSWCKAVNPPTTESGLGADCSKLHQTNKRWIASHFVDNTSAHDLGTSPSTPILLSKPFLPDHLTLEEHHMYTQIAIAPQDSFTMFVVAQKLITGMRRNHRLPIAPQSRRAARPSHAQTPRTNHCTRHAPNRSMSGQVVATPQSTQHPSSRFCNGDPVSNSHFVPTCVRLPC